MSYEAIATLLWRFLGLVIIMITLPLIPIAVFSTPTSLVPAALGASLAIGIAALLIVASKTLGRVTAAGLDE